MLSPGLLTHLVREAIDAARTGDLHDVDEAIYRISQLGDVMDLLAMCRVCADTAVRALLALYGPADPSRGEMWVLDDLGDAQGPERLFAARVVTAHANRDSDTVCALVMAADRAGGSERCGSLRELLLYAAGLDARAAQMKRAARNE